MNIKLFARKLTAALFAMLLTGGFAANASTDMPVSACGTLSAPATTYFLTKNLTATGDCLVIGADNVAIDMKGHTITGNGSGSGITDGGVLHDFAIIANGTIRNFSNGINLSDSGRAIISNVDSSKNKSDGIFIEGCCDTLNAITADNNDGAGIVIDSDDSSLSKIQANHNGDGGIVINEGFNLLVASTVNNNTGNGVQMSEGDSFVTGSKIENNSGIGLQLNGDDNGVIKSSTSKNGGDGIEFPTSEDNMVTESKSNGNGGTGIDEATERFGTISGVQAKNNSVDGVNMECFGSTASLTAIHNSGTNLVQTKVSGEPCANVNLNAP